MSGTLIARSYEPEDEEAWDALVDRATAGTFLHSRRFLAYHGDRFADASGVVCDQRGTIVGVLPAAPVPERPGLVASHPGATFGGLVHDGTLSGARMLAALQATVDLYAAAGYDRLLYAAVPSTYHRRPSGDDLYALFRIGADRVRCDLSCAVDLADAPPPSSRRRRGLARARREGVRVERGRHLAAELWPVVEQNLTERHGARPVHSLDDMELLLDLFPEAIEIVAGRVDGNVVGGVVLFHSPRVAHSQYIASSREGNDARVLDAVFASCLETSREAGRRFFDFGTSNRDAGWVLNEGLYDFKVQFGGGGVAHEFYEVDLRTATPNPVSP